MEVTEVIFARGHENIRATHKTTFEVTKEVALSKKGDCIIAISANKAMADLSHEFKANLCKEKAQLTITIQAGEITEVVKASGSSRLILTHPTDMVVRKSDYVCSRTLAVKANKAACDFSRKIIAELKNSEQRVKITLTATV